MTIPGVDAIVAMSIVAAVGDFSRFPSADKVVSYVGLNPKVRQSGESPANHGRISKAGRSQARGLLFETQSTIFERRLTIGDFWFLDSDVGRQLRAPGGLGYEQTWGRGW